MEKEKFKAFLKERNLTISKLSVASGMTRQAIYAMMNTNSSPHRQTVLKLCTALNITENELYNILGKEPRTYTHELVKDDTNENIIPE